jgi:hypothetical protein
MSTGAAQPREKEYLKRRQPVPVLIGGAALDERPDRGIAFVVDLTERKRAEETPADTKLCAAAKPISGSTRLSRTGTWVSECRYCSPFKSFEP